MPGEKEDSEFALKKFRRKVKMKMPRCTVGRRAFLNIILIAASLFPAVSFADAEKIFRGNSKSVTVVETFDEKGNPLSQGSGFIVRADGAVVTSYHVIINAKDIKVKTGDRVSEVEGLIHVDKESDLVILKIKDASFPTVRLGDINKESIGEKVYVISSPKGFENTISDGILSGIRDTHIGKRMLQITASFSPGSSGGPVFNESGEVIGVATFLIEDAQNINFAMPVNLITGQINGKKITSLKDFQISDAEERAAYWFHLGLAHGNAGIYKQAIEAFKLAIKIRPDFAEAHFNLGIAYENVSMFNEAIGEFKETIRIKPDDAGAHYNIGVSYLAIGNKEVAVEEYKILKNLDTARAEMLFDLIIK